MVASRRFADAQRARSGGDAGDLSWGALAALAAAALRASHCWAPDVMVADMCCVEFGECGTDGALGKCNWEVRAKHHIYGGFLALVGAGLYGAGGKATAVIVGWLVRIIFLR